MEPQLPGSVSSAPDRTAVCPFNVTKLTPDFTDIGHENRIRIDHGELEAGQGQAYVDRSCGTRGQDQVFTRIDTAGSAELKKVIRKDLVHQDGVVTRFRSPQTFFQFGERFDIVRREARVRHGSGLNW
jgi:hypothetical protein